MSSDLKKGPTDILALRRFLEPVLSEWYTSLDIRCVIYVVRYMYITRMSHVYHTYITRISLGSTDILALGRFLKPVLSEWYTSLLIHQIFEEFQSRFKVWSQGLVWRFFWFVFLDGLVCRSFLWVFSAGFVFVSLLWVLQKRPTKRTNKKRLTKTKKTHKNFCEIRPTKKTHKNFCETEVFVSLFCWFVVSVFFVGLVCSSRLLF